MNKKRIAAGIIDFLICTVMQFILEFPIIVIPILTSNMNEKSLSFDQIFILNLYITILTMTIFICRDVFGSKSFGKRIMKLNIINAETGNSVNIFRRVLRNLTIIIWPIDIIYLLISGNRLGDKIAKTTVKSTNI